MKDTINDLQKWKHKVEGWVRSFSNNQRTESGNGTETKSTFLATKLHSKLNTQTTINTHSKGRPDVSKSSVSENTSGATTTVLKSTISKDSESGDFYKTLSNIKTLKDRINVLKDAISKDKAVPLLTLFTTWPTKKDKFLVHNSTINNWEALSPFVNPVLFTDEPGLAAEAKSRGWNVLPVTKTAVGIPILKYMYLQAMSKFKSKFYAYSNGDILFTDGLVATLLSALSFKVDYSVPMMMVGQRTNVQYVTAQEASTFDNVAKAGKRGKLFTTFAEDYFITTPNYPWKDCAEVVIGRRAYDNWLVLYARKRKHITIDGTKTILAVHQTTKAGNHEGHHQPNGNYNDRLLSRKWRGINYGAGLTSCTSYFTQLNSNGEPDLVTRNIHKGCFPI